MVTVDEQTVMHALFSTYPSAPFAGNYSLIRLLIQAEVTYAIKVTEKNQEIITATARLSSKLLTSLPGMMKKKTSSFHGPVSPNLLVRKIMTGESMFKS